MEDIRIGRAAKGAGGSKAIQAADTPILPRSDYRFALIISAPSAGRVSLGFGTAAVLDAGITLYASGPPLILTLKEHGDLICLDIHAIQSVGGTQLGWVESVFGKEIDREESAYRRA